MLIHSNDFKTIKIIQEKKKISKKIIYKTIFRTYLHKYKTI